MSVKLKTYGEQLEEVQAAISKVMQNQRYSINGREFWKADLEMLQKREEYLTKKLQTYGDVIPTQTMSTGIAFGVSFG